VRAWLREIRRAAQAAAPAGARAAVAALDGAGWAALFDAAGPLGALFAAKRHAARALIVAVRAALDQVGGARRLLEPQAFPPPFHALSGFPLAELDGVADRIGIKLYTMHWPMLARYWARDLIGDGTPAALDALTAAVAWRFGLTDDLVDGALLRYPEPHDAHSAGRHAQLAKLRAAQAAAGRVPVTAFVHSYGPVRDVLMRYELASDSGLALWINRYGYLSDAKLEALGGSRKSLGAATSRASTTR